MVPDIKKPVPSIFSVTINENRIAERRARPLAAPIGTNKGLRTIDFLNIIIEEATVPVVVDAGIGAPSDAAKAIQTFPYTQTDYSAYIILGLPVAGQKLEDVKALILEEIEKMKRGEFDDDLLPSVKNNMKLLPLQAIIDIVLNLRF